jgi:alkanesulfonate monooxygenase SsuD/methylene tetrahydromethanopterin reductase-like flavin-dependent oxidoreductase (luciferase family)
MDGSPIDNDNRRVCKETLKVIKKAWTEESFEYDGDYYKVPYPYSEGITEVAERQLELFSRRIIPAFSRH